MREIPAFVDVEIRTGKCKKQLVRISVQVIPLNYNRKNMEVWVVEKKLLIEQGKTSLGIEFGSTRIKAVLIAEGGEPLASGSYEWENQLVNGIWTYSLLN